MTSACHECAVKKATHVCSGCHTAAYCSDQCQVKNWTTKHALICGGVKKKQKMEHHQDDDFGPAILQQIIAENRTDLIIQITRLLSNSQVNYLLLSGNGDFLMNNSRGTRMFWYTRIQMEQFNQNDVHAFDPTMDYRMEYYRLIGANSILRQRNRQYLFEHPTLGVFSITPDHIQELDGRHITFFNPIGMPNTPEMQEFFRNIVDQLRRRRARESFVEYGMMSRSGFYLNVDDLIWLFTHVFTHGFVLKE
jgi:hypothetical protein